MSNTNNNQIAKINPENWMVLSLPDEEIREIINENIGDNVLRVSDLTAIKMPAAGSTTWVYPAAEGEVETKSFEGVVIFHRDIKQCYDVEFGQAETNRPDCWSDDGKTPNPQGKYAKACGFKCDACAFNQFGSGVNGSRKCRPHKLIFFMTEQGILPMVMFASAMSEKPFMDYAKLLLQAGKRLSGVVTAVTLRQEENTKKVKYAVCQFSKVADLPPTEAKRLRAIGDEWMPHLKATEIDMSADTVSVNMSSDKPTFVGEVPKAPAVEDEVIEAEITAPKDDNVPSDAELDKAMNDIDNDDIPVLNM
jgi:hypothetical protein